MSTSAERELADRLLRARALQEAGQARAAETEYRAVLPGRLRRDERHHPDTLAAWQNLELLIAVDGRAEAAAMHRDVLTARTRVLGAHHPDTRTSAAALRR
jgi:hypothetical protein